MSEYPVFCSWCASVGIHHVVRWESYPNSSGMCLGCFLIERIRRVLGQVAIEVENLKSLVGG